MGFRVHAAIVACFALSANACAGARGDGATLGARSIADVAQTAPEQTILSAGAVLTEPLDFDQGDQHYIGAITASLVSGTPEHVLAAFGDAGALAEMLPRTKRVTLVDDRPEARRMELEQGNSVVDATYTVAFVPGVPGKGELTFRLDRSRRHDIEDVYGYVRVVRFDEKRSLVTLGAAVNVGSGLTEMLFGKRVQDVILSTPYAMRDYFARSASLPDGAFVAENDRH
jgi:carbon monoxide dehydrogenase subunit G